MWYQVRDLLSAKSLVEDGSPRSPLPLRHIEEIWSAGNWLKESGQHECSVVADIRVGLRYLSCYNGRCHDYHHTARGPKVDVKEAFRLEVLMRDISEHVLVVSVSGESIYSLLQVE